MTTITKSSPPSLTALGFDFGLKKIGVAIGQTITGTASPVGIIQVHHGELPDMELNKLLTTWHPDVLIVGIPFNMDGSISPLVKLAEHFALSLEARCSLPVYRVDERLSTRNARYELEAMAAQSGVKNKPQRLDAFAACLIIETWLGNIRK